MIVSRLDKRLLPFKKKDDYCSFWPDACWGDCCGQHDDDYLYGEVSKSDADKYLRECVIASGHPIIAEIMYIGVSTFGWSAWFRRRLENLKRGDVV